MGRTPSSMVARADGQEVVMGAKARRVVTLVAVYAASVAIGQLLTAALSRGDEASDELVLRSILGGRRLASRADALRAVSVVAVMGGVDLDLRHAQLAVGGESVDLGSADLDVLACMGGMKVTVPEGWAVDTDARAFAGGVNSQVAGPRTGTELPTLRVRARLCMGGVKIVARRPT